MTTMTSTIVHLATDMDAERAFCGTTDGSGQFTADVQREDIPNILRILARMSATFGQPVELCHECKVHVLERCTMCGLGREDH